MTSSKPVAYTQLDVYKRQELPYSIPITVPPMGGLVLRPEPLPKLAPNLALLTGDIEPEEEPLEAAAAADEELAQPE